MEQLTLDERWTVLAMIDFCEEHWAAFLDKNEGVFNEEYLENNGNTAKDKLQ